MDNETLRADLGARLRGFREERGDTLESFAGLIGVDAPALSRMERGQRNISTLVLRRASEVLEVSMDAFFRSAKPVQLMRTGDNGSDDVNVVLEWANELQRDMRAVDAYRSGLAS